MPKIFTTPCTRTRRRKFKFLPSIFRLKKLNKPITLHEQAHLVRQTRLRIQNILAKQTFGETVNLKLNNTIAMPISEILEDISQNISKMDQNLYTAKASMEEILRVDSNDREFVSLD